ncbi:sulfite exporter TauE/SafE family protein [Labilibacter sediminis]|nr:sulfite exporter TauE/SafE family protein [Labilibacter sediminis]
MEILNSLLENSQFPILSAFILGLMTAISPCPMATNITAIGFISKDIENQKRVFFNGIIYTLGRGVSYSLIGILFFLGASQLALGDFFQTWGERIIGPLLLLIGLFMLGVIKINLPGGLSINNKLENISKKGFIGVFLLGLVFALAFCPYSGVLYFGMLIPITISHAGGLYLPVVFAIATGLPVILFAWILAFSIGSVGTFYNQMKKFEIWFRRIIACVFILFGLYYILIIFLGLQL